MKFTILIPILMVFLFGCASNNTGPLPQDEKERLTDSLIQKKDFIGIFDHREELVEVTPGRETHLTKPVEKFILNCCRDKASALELLRRNGFKVFPVKDWYTKNYQEAYAAGRFSSSANLFHSTHYGVIVYINSGKVQKVTANYFGEVMPPARSWKDRKGPIGKGWNN